MKIIDEFLFVSLSLLSILFIFLLGVQIGKERNKKDVIYCKSVSEVREHSVWKIECQDNWKVVILE